MSKISTDATRKIATLRRWARSPGLIDSSYLAEIADEFERVHEIMTRRGETLSALDGETTPTQEPSA